MWTQLRTLSKENAEGVAQHLVMAAAAARHRPRGRPGARGDRRAPGRPGSRGSGGARAGRLPPGRLGQGAGRVPDRAPALRLVTPAAAHGRRRASAGPPRPGPRAGRPRPRRGRWPATRRSSWPSSSPASGATRASSTPRPPGSSCPSSTRAAARPGAPGCSTPTPRPCWPSATAPARGSGSATRSTRTSRSRRTRPSGSTSWTASSSSTSSAMTTTPTSAARVAETLAERYTGVVCDLDGVVRRGAQAVPHAVEQLTALRVPVVYATNNASLTPQDVADQLLGLGLPVGPANVVTSSQAGAAYVASLVPAGSPVLAVGGPGVAAALRRGGPDPGRRRAEAGVVAVLQGYGAERHGGATWPRPATPSRTAPPGSPPTATRRCRRIAASLRATEPCSAPSRPRPESNPARPPGSRSRRSTTCRWPASGCPSRRCSRSATGSTPTSSAP